MPPWLPPRLRQWLPRLALLAGIAAAVVWAGIERDRLDPQAIHAWLSGLGVWAPLLYVAIYAVGTVAFIPGMLFALAGGAMFGPFWGVLLNLSGATIGATLAFLIARYLAGDWVARRAPGRLDRLITGVEAEGWRFVAFIRLVPLFPFNLANYALGLTRIGVVPYVATSIVCMAPGAVAYTWLGHAGREALTGDASSIRYGLMALGLLAAIVFLPRLVTRLRRGRPAWTEPENLRRQIEKDRPTVTVLDVRGPDEFEGPLGHIRGALNLPVGEIPNRLDEIDSQRNAPVILVCRTDKRSADAAASLRAAGFRDVRVLRGGMERWNTLGFETRHGGRSGNEQESR